MSSWFASTTTPLPSVTNTRAPSASLIRRFSASVSCLTTATPTGAPLRMMRLAKYSPGARVARPRRNCTDRPFASAAPKYSRVDRFRPVPLVPPIRLRTPLLLVVTM
jgi:hypothetical protein